MTAESTLADKGIAVFETELELLVDQYRCAPACLPPQRIAEVFGRYFALECLRAYGVNGSASGDAQELDCSPYPSMLVPPIPSI
jgi:hypothetical protein